jgi:hypothetical protein
VNWLWASTTQRGEPMIDLQSRLGLGAENERSQNVHICTRLTWAKQAFMACQVPLCTAAEHTQIPPVRGSRHVRLRTDREKNAQVGPAR